jgi:hypothetical protein
MEKLTTKHRQMESKQLIYSYLVNGFKTTSVDTPSENVKRYRQRWLQNVVLRSLFGDGSETSDQNWAERSKRT